MTQKNKPEPFIRKKNNIIPIEIKKNPHCSQCGRELFPVDMYVCPNMNCPCQAKIIF